MNRIFHVRGNGRHGLTLIELLVVVLILSAIAGAAISLTDTFDQQTRADDTRARMAMIRRAIVGDSIPNADGHRILSGFVADVGRLPLDLEELVMLTPVSGVEARPFGPQTPVFFDPTPDSSGVSNGSGDEVDLTIATLNKGWRGPYLRDPSGGPFRDGWGNHDINPTVDVLNYGWAVGSPAAVATGPDAAYSMDYASFGSDGASDLIQTPADVYATDMADSILVNDWTLSANALQFTIVNDSGVDYSSNPTQPNEIGIALLAYVDGGWLRVDSDLQPVPADPAQPVTFSFTSTQPLPQGRILAVVFQYGADEIPHTADDSQLAAIPVDIHPRTTPPMQTIVLK